MSGTISPVAGEANALAPMLGTYSIAELVYFVRNLKLAQTWALDRFFPNVIESEAPEVAIDVDVGKRRLAPFCSPLVEGRFVESRRYMTNLFTPPYIKDKRRPDLLKPVRRAMGERLLGAMTPAQRLEANLAYEMADQIDMITRRQEWMAMQALATGTVTVTGDGYPTTVVDFRRDAALTVALSGTAQWGQTGVYPTAYLESWAQTIMQKSGSFPTDVIMTTSAFAAFKADINVINALWMQRAGASQIEYGGVARIGGVFMGTWGQFNIWLYNDWYVDPNTDIEYPMLTDGTVIMTSPALEGIRAYGLIQDPEFAYGALAYAPKIWTEKDPAGINLMMQSAPMIIPARPNASFAATVMSPSGAVTAPTI